MRCSPALAPLPLLTWLRPAPTRSGHLLHSRAPFRHGLGPSARPWPGLHSPVPSPHPQPHHQSSPCPQGTRGECSEIVTQDQQERPDRPEPFRVTILGAGFAGVALAWHLLELVDEAGIGAGASGMSGGLLHPFSPKGKLLWQGHEAWFCAVKLLEVAEAEFAKQQALAAKAGKWAAESQAHDTRQGHLGTQDPRGHSTHHQQLAWRRGALRLPLTPKHSADFHQSAASEPSGLPLPLTHLHKQTSTVLKGPPQDSQSCDIPDQEQGKTAPLVSGQSAVSAQAGAADSSAKIHAGPGAGVGQPVAFVISPVTAALMVPGILSPVPTSALFVPCAITINPLRYLEALWAACLRHAVLADQSGAPGTKATWHKAKVTSLADFMEGPAHNKDKSGRCQDSVEGTDGDEARLEQPDALVVCLGAAALKLTDLPTLGLPSISLSRGHIVTLKCQDPRALYPCASPSLLGSTWLAVRGSSEALLGATVEDNLPDPFAVPSDEEREAAREQLLGAARAVLPSLAQWESAGTRWGIRALSQRSKFGKLPVARRLDARSCSHPWRADGAPDVPKGQQKHPTASVYAGRGRAEAFRENEWPGDRLGETSGSDTRPSPVGPAVWFFGALGSRGLIYHAWLAEKVALAVVLGDEGVIPAEFRGLSEEKGSKRDGDRSRRQTL